jgi:hypothetical protein
MHPLEHHIRPLLCSLHDIHGYALTIELNISHSAYADDLKLISPSLTALQLMLNIVFNYLSLFNMIANALKTEILTNLSRLALEQLLATHPLPHLGNSPIHAIHPNNHLARILGAYITMDGLHQKTIDHALETVKKQIKLIQMKLTPSPIAVYLINTVIIPCLLYRLQISCVPVIETIY